MLKFSKDLLDTNPFSIVITSHQVKKNKERRFTEPEKILIVPEMGFFWGGTKPVLKNL